MKTTTFIKRKKLESILGISRATINRRIKSDPNFPKPFKIGRDNVFDIADVERYSSLIKEGVYN